jgi:hypothetical protein
MLPNRSYHSLLSDCSSLTRVADSSPTPFSSLDPSLPRLVRHWQAGCESSSCCGLGALLGAGGSCASPGIHKLLAYSVYILAPHVHRAPPHLLMRRPFAMPHTATCISHSTVTLPPAARKPACCPVAYGPHCRDACKHTARMRRTRTQVYPRTQACVAMGSD